VIGKKFFRNPESGPKRAEDVHRVLVVDDVPDILDYFQGVFRRVRGVDVELTVEADAVNALDRVRETAYDLVVSDFRMRGATGVDVLQAARERNPEGLRVLMTGYNEVPAAIEEIRAADVDGYVQKPLAAQDLLLLILDLLNRNPRTLDQMRSEAREMERVAEAEERNGTSQGHAPAFFTA
jgi:two-component system, probable response regulator PhcQ